MHLRRRLCRALKVLSLSTSEPDALKGKSACEVHGGREGEREGGREGGKEKIV